MGEKLLDAIALGACNLDEVAFVPKFAEAEEKINATSYYPPCAAGVAMDCISQVNKLGMRTGWFGITGDDMAGQNAVLELVEDGIDISRAITAKGERTSKAWISVNNKTGERCHVIIPMGEAGFINQEQVVKNKDYFENARLIHLELLQMPIDGMIEAAKIAKAAGTAVSFDLDVAPAYAYESKYATPKSLKELIANTTILKACKNAAVDFCGHCDYETAAEEMLNMGPDIVIVTIGEKGCIIAYRADGEIKSIISPGFSGLTIVDTTGAGDAFQGGFIYGYLKGYDYAKCGAIANACGYLKSTRVGARNSVPRAEVEAFMKKQGWIESEGGLIDIF